MKAVKKYKYHGFHFNKTLLGSQNKYQKTENSAAGMVHCALSGNIKCSQEIYQNIHWCPHRNDVAEKKDLPPK